MGQKHKDWQLGDLHCIDLGQAAALGSISVLSGGFTWMH